MARRPRPFRPSWSNCWPPERLGFRTSFGHNRQMTVEEIFAQVMMRPAALATVVVVNLIPVFGVRFLGWDAAEILILYWAENVVLGLLTLPRLIAASKGGAQGVFFALFFLIHYGLFCLGHLTFALLIVGDFTDEAGGLYAPLLVLLRQPSFQWALAGMAVMNLITQAREWWLPGLWRTADPRTEMFKPYGRLFVLHMTVLFGSAVVMMLDAPVGAILVLCLLKAALELRLLAFSENEPEAKPA